MEADLYISTVIRLAYLSREIEAWPDILPDIWYPAMGGWNKLQVVM